MTPSKTQDSTTLGTKGQCYFNVHEVVFKRISLIIIPMPRRKTLPLAARNTLATAAMPEA